MEIVVAATTDVHGRLRGWDYYENSTDMVHSLARAATVVDSLRGVNRGRVILLDAGDLLQGNPLAYVAARVEPAAPSPIIAAMNAMDYDAAGVGNHEFNYGLATFDRTVAQARFPFLAANAFTPDGQRAYPAYRIVERGGARIAIIGATTPGSMVWDRDNLRGRVVLRDIVPSVRDAVADVRRQGVDVVVVVMHSGLDGRSSYDTTSTGVGSENVAARVAREVDGIDLIVFGHSHREVADTVIGSTMLMQPGNWARSVGVATIGLSRVVGQGADDWRVTDRTGVLIPTAGHAEDSAVLAATSRAHAATVKYVMSPIGFTPVEWSADSARVADTPIIDLILEVERRATGADLASTAAFSLEAGLDAGPITIAELARLYPYDNTLRVVRITGEQLREYLEYSARYYNRYEPDGSSGAVVNRDVPGYNFDIVAGVHYTIDLSRPIGSRVTRLVHDGRPVAPTDSFTLALNNYRQTGGGGYAMLAGAPLVSDKGQEIRQLIIDHVSGRSITPSAYLTRNWRIIPGEAAAAAHREMNGRRRASAPAAAPHTDTAYRESDTPRLRIIATNDFHGAFGPREYDGRTLGGGAALSAAIARARAECEEPTCYSLLVDGGDMWQGTAASNLAFGRPVVELYDAMGYAAAALGNHEFDWGIDTLRARMRDASFGILAANVRYDDGRDVEWIPGDTIVVRGPLEIGIIGVATVATPWTTKQSNVTGLRFDAPAPIVDSTARSLRARGADAIIVLAHAGAFCDSGGDSGCDGEIIDLARALTEPVDAIVSGHTHSFLRAQIDETAIVQARSSGRSIGVVDIVPGAHGTDINAENIEVRTVRADADRPAPAIVAILDRAFADVAPLVDRPVATFAKAMPRSGDQYALGNLIADAQRWAGNSDVALTNNGGIRANLHAGPATYGEMFEVQPFANRLLKLTVRGSVLREYIGQIVSDGSPGVHVSGMTVSFQRTGQGNAELATLRVGGRPLRDGATYTIVLNDFLTGRGAGRTLAAAALRSDQLDRDDLEVFTDYARSLPQPVQPPTGDRVGQSMPGVRAPR